MTYSTRYTKYHEDIKELHEKGHSSTEIANVLLDRHNLEVSLPSLRRSISNITKSFGIKALVKIEIDQPVKEQIRKLFLRRDTWTPEEISDAVNIGIGRVRAYLAELKEEGFNLKIDENSAILSKVIAKADPTSLNVKKMSTGMHRFGACGDNHMGSRYERMDVLNALYDHYEEEGIKVVYNTGNWIDGEARFNKHDLNVYGMDRQVDYFVNNYPQREGIKTYFVAGDDHEGWYTQREGIDIGKYAERKAKAAGREDLIYVGYMEGDIVIPTKNGSTIIRLIHPGGGSAYATSYTMQKLVESFTGGEKPHVVLAGHYHKAEYLFYRGVHIVQTGCTMDQSPFMRKKKLAAHVGGWDIEFSTDDNGAITRFRSEFMPFYDNAYYQKWKYKF